MDILPSKNKYLSFDEKSIVIFSLLISLAIFWSIANFQYIGPGNFDIYINFQISIILSIAFFVYFFFYKKSRSTNISLLSFAWLYFLLLIAIQPSLNNILYSDGLIFVVAELSLVFILSVLIANFPNKILLLRMVTLAVFFVALFTLFTLVVQTLEWSFFYDWLVLPVEYGGRPIANVSQPNQAAFVLVLGVLALFYLRETINIVHKPAIFLSLFFLLSFGLALTSSRGGIILMVLAILSYVFLGNDSKHQKLKYIILWLIIFILGYLLGTIFLEFCKGGAEKGFERFTGSMLKSRASLLTQALLIFSDHWLVGAGWGNFASAGLTYADKLDWVYFSNHSHLIFSQIMAELGIVGLLGSFIFVYVLVVKLLAYRSQKDNKEYRLAMSICLCFLAYSFSEFPLWYLKYLLIFTIYLSFLDIPTKVNTVIFNTKYMLILPLIILLSSIFYLNEYSKYTKVYDYLVLSDDSEAIKFKVYSDLSIPYGFTFYNEAMLFYLFPLNEESLAFKLEVGNRVSQRNPIPNIMIKQAIFLGLDKQSSNSLKLFQASCLYNYSQHCDFVTERLAYLAEKLPEYFVTINTEFVTWRNNSTH